MKLQVIHDKIYTIRNQKVMLDFDLAELYQVETRILKQAVRRNLKRFPSDFMFELSKEEFKNLTSQIVTSSHGGLRYLPFAFTEQGVSMLSSVLKSDIAIDISITIIRAFVQLRQLALTHSELSAKLNEIENKYDQQFESVYDALNYLNQKDKQEVSQEQRNKIGYK
ncbi:MAG: DNA-binding protein [Flavobacteriaceae bacterium]|nr:MAG: DNA-binding protein [Flavobacteriaceae bacterium]